MPCPCPGWRAGQLTSVWLSDSVWAAVWTSGNIEGQLLDDCVIDSRGCDESIPYHCVSTQVSGPPWPLPSEPLSLEQTLASLPPSILSSAH